MLNGDFEDKSPLGCLYHWERTRPDAVHFTQPTGGGNVSTYTWREIMREVRGMAAHRLARGLPPKSQIGLFGKNSAH